MTKEEFIEKYRIVRASLYETKNTGVINIDVGSANAVRNLTEQELLDMGWGQVQVDYFLSVFAAINGLVPEYVAYSNALSALTDEVNTVCDIMV